MAHNPPDFLADREGLTGKAREKFQRLLREDYGVKPSTRHSSRAAPALAWRLGLGTLLFLYLSQGLTLWPLIATGGFLVLNLSRVFANPSGPSDPNVEWHVYCQLIRPFILSRHPGLLDRNRPGCPPPDPTFLASLSRSRPWHALLTGEDWVQTLLIGLTGGLALLTVAQATLERAPAG